MRAEIMCFIVHIRCPCIPAATAATAPIRTPNAIRIFMVVPPCAMEYEGRVALPLREYFALLQVLLLPQRLLDARARVAHFQGRRLAGQRVHQLDVLSGQLRAHLVGDVGQRAFALVAALADEPLPEELLVEHLLVLAAAEALVASLGDPVAARGGRGDLGGDPQLSALVGAELVLWVDQDQSPLARPGRPGGGE